MTNRPTTALKYLVGYPPELLAQVQTHIDQGTLGPLVAQRYPQAHAIRSERALVDYVGDLRARYLRSAPPLAKVAWDSKLHIVKNALGTHTAISRVQGQQLKAKREIRISSLFRDAPADFLRMIVVHELAHLKQSAHDKAFYALCCHMEPRYHQLEFDVRLWLTALELPAPPPAPPQEAFSAASGADVPPPRGC